MPAERIFDVLVVGAGPAGIAAACAAAESGASVGLVDDNPAPGGQIWRGADPEARPWLARLAKAEVRLVGGACVFDCAADALLAATESERVLALRYRSLVLATGARERFVPFPGWTLPNVVGAGGLQALVKGGLPIERKRVVIAGTGPLLLAVAIHLAERGANVRLIAEQASAPSLAHFGLSLLRHPQKLSQGLALKRRLRGVRQELNCWPIAASGRGTLQSVTLRQGGNVWEEDCDYLACSYGLVPNVELPLLLGCALRDGAVAVDEWQQTSVPQVYCAGEPTGIGGLDLALLEGEIAGYAAAGNQAEAANRHEARRKARAFAAALQRAYRLRDELRALPERDTIICRCEDVPHTRLRGCESWRAAKLETRCGMGPCQGRICGPAAGFLYGWSLQAVRPPVFPVSVGQMLSNGDRNQ